MKLHLYWGFLCINTVLARALYGNDGALRQDIRPRGESYDKCIRELVNDGVQNASRAIPNALPCLGVSVNGFYDACLSKFTDLESEERREAMINCFQEQVGQLRNCMTAESVSGANQESVVEVIKEEFAKAIDDDPATGCNDDE